MRTATEVPQGWLKRSEAAAYLSVSEWKFIQLSRQYALLTKIERGTHIYRVQDIEALARALLEES